MMSAARIVRGVRRRLRSASKQAELKLRHRITGSTVWIDYGWMRLPYHADDDNQEIYYHLDGAAWWKKELEILAPYIGSGGVAIDVGANLGFLTTLLSKLVTPIGSVHSFEPSPIVYRKLCEVIAANDLRNVQVYNVGCGEETAKLELFGTTSSGNASLQAPKRVSNTRTIEEVTIVRLDDYLLPRLTRLDLLKIDTEGYEDSVLAGACQLLSLFRPVIYLELTSEYIDSSRRAVSLLKAARYRFVVEPVLEDCHNGQNFIAVPV